MVGATRGCSRGKKGKGTRPLKLHEEGGGPGFDKGS